MKQARFKRFMGPAIALCAAASYGVNTTFSKLAFTAGTDPTSLALFRYWSMGAILMIWLLWRSKPFRLDVNWKLLLAPILGSYMITLGHLGAVNYIPVSLSGIIFYSFPFMIIAINVLVFKQKLTLLRLIAFVLAFAGLYIALGPTISELDWRGIALALLGAVGSVLFLMSYERLPKDVDAIAMTSTVIGACALLGSLTLVLGAELQPPTDPVGWWYIALIAFFSLLAFILTLVLFQYASAETASLFFNFEPVVIILMAWWVLGENLSPNTFIGIAMVLIALLMSDLKKAKVSLKEPV